MKDIKEVLHLYLGCLVLHTRLDEYGRLVTVNENGFHGITLEGHGTTVSAFDYDFKLVLSRLSDMSEEGAIELCKLQTPEKRHDDITVHDISHCDVHFTDGSKWYGDGVEELNDLYIHFDQLNSLQFTYLLKKGYWLF